MRIRHQVIYKHCKELGLVTVSKSSEMVHPLFKPPKRLKFMICGLTKKKCSSANCPIKDSLTDHN